MTLEEYANLVLLAAKIREESWDEKECKYNINIEDACIKATKELKIDEAFWYPIYLSFLCWNDVIAWAEHIKKRGDIKGFFAILDDTKTKKEIESEHTSG